MPDEHESLIRVEIRHLREAVINLNQTVKDLGAELRKEYVRKELYDSQHKDLTKDIESLQNSRSWIVYLIIGLVIAAIVGSVLVTR